MFSFIRTRTSGFKNFPAGKFSILPKFWILFKSHQIDPKFHVDHEYLVYFHDSSMVKALSLISGIVLENLRESSKSTLFCLHFSILPARF